MWFFVKQALLSCQWTNSIKRIVKYYILLTNFIYYSLVMNLWLYRRSFGSVLDVIPLADTVTKLTARCGICGKRAFFTLRKVEETQTELVGGAEAYMPVCRQHYVNGQAVVGVARSVLETSQISQVQKGISVEPQTACAL